MIDVNQTMSEDDDGSPRMEDEGLFSKQEDQVGMTKRDLLTAAGLLGVVGVSFGVSFGIVRFLRSLESPEEFMERSRSEIAEERTRLEELHGIRGKMWKGYKFSDFVYLQKEADSIATNIGWDSLNVKISGNYIEIKLAFADTQDRVIEYVWDFERVDEVFSGDLVANAFYILEKPFVWANPKFPPLYQIFRRAHFGPTDQVHESAGNSSVSAFLGTTGIADSVFVGERNNRVEIPKIGPKIMREMQELLLELI